MMHIKNLGNIIYLLVKEKIVVENHFVIYSYKHKNCYNCTRYTLCKFAHVIGEPMEWMGWYQWSNKFVMGGGMNLIFQYDLLLKL